MSEIPPWKEHRDNVLALLKKNGREDLRSDAESCYYNLMQEGKTEEELAYQVLKLSCDLRYSAAEMWVDDAHDLSGITLEDIKEIRDNIKKAIGDIPIEDLHYYSDTTTKMLYHTLLFARKKEKEIYKANDSVTGTKWSFYQHMVCSCTKELYTYRAFKTPPNSVRFATEDE